MASSVKQLYLIVLGDLFGSLQWIPGRWTLNQSGPSEKGSLYVISSWEFSRRSSVDDVVTSTSIGG